MKRTVVTGGFGFIGFHLIKYLLENKEREISVIDRTPVSSYDNDIKKLIEKYKSRLNIFNIEIAKSKNFPETDEIYHLAGSVASKKVKANKDLIYNNIKALENLLSFYSTKQTRILYISSAEVAGDIQQNLPTDENCSIGWTDPSNPRWHYSIAKFLCETILTNYPQKINYNIARLSNTYGEQMKHDYVVKSLIKRILNDESPLTITNASDTRSFTYVLDIVKGLVKIMESNYTNEVFNLGTPQETSIVSLAQKLLKIAGKDTKGIEIIDDHTIPERRLPDITKANRLLHWSPKISLDEGLMRTYSFYKTLES